MKTVTLSGSYPANMMKMITALTILFFWILNQNVYAAGAPARPAKSPTEKRADANVHIEEGLKLQKAGNYKEPSKKYKKAVKAYKKAITLSSSLAEANEYLGEAYAEMGKFDLAEKELKILHRLG